MIDAGYKHGRGYNEVTLWDFMLGGFTLHRIIWLECNNEKHVETYFPNCLFLLLTTQVNSHSCRPTYGAEFYSLIVSKTSVEYQPSLGKTSSCKDGLIKSVTTVGSPLNITSAARDRHKYCLSPSLLHQRTHTHTHSYCNSLLQVINWAKRLE